MWAKTLLSIVGLLFASSQVYADYSECQPTYSSPTCTPGTCTSGDDGYYIAKDTGELVKVSNSDSTAKCALVTENGYYSTKDGRLYLKNGDNIDSLEFIQNCSKAGDIIGNGDLCLDTTNIASLNDDNNYLFTDNGNVFGEGAGKNVVITSAEGSDKFVMNNDLTTGEYCVSDAGVVGSQLVDENDRLNAFCNGGCNVYECENGVCSTDLTLDCSRSVPGTCDPTKTSVEDESNNEENCTDGAYYLSSGTIYLCETNVNKVKCVAQNGIGGNPAVPIGYFINTGVSDSYISCDGDNCSEVTKGSITATDCTGKKPGDLIYVEGDSYKLCSGASASAIAQGDMFLVEADTGYTANDPFYLLTENKSYKVSINSDVGGGLNVVVSTTEDGNYIVNNEKKIVTNTGAVTLIQCSGGDGTCATPDSLPLGYLKNKLAAVHTDVPYIKCQGSCTAIAPDSAVDCTGKKAGEIIIKTGTTDYKLCVEDGIPIDLTGSNVVKYMVKIANANANESPFSTIAPGDSSLDDKYVIVDVSTDAVLHTQGNKKKIHFKYK